MSLDWIDILKWSLLVFGVTFSACLSLSFLINSYFDDKGKFERGTR